MTFFEFEAFVGYIKLDRVFFWRKAVRLLLNRLLIPSKSAFVDVMLNNEKEEKPLEEKERTDVRRWIQLLRKRSGHTSMISNAEGLRRQGASA